MAHTLRRCVSLRWLLASNRSTTDSNGIDLLRSRSLLKRQSLSWSQTVSLRRQYSTETVTDSSIQGAEGSHKSSERVDGDEKGLKLSDSCVKVLKERLLSVTEGDPDTVLRVIVEGGGCSGFQYKFNLDNKINEDDRVFEREGAKVVVDDISLSLLEGSTIDYHHELIRSSFRITGNPNAEMGCSCGVSFALK